MIKGAFKDHLVTWIQEYIEDTYDKKQAKQILNDIDHQLVKFYIYNLVSDIFYLALLLCLYFQEFEGFPKVEALSSGQVMILRH